MSETEQPYEAYVYALREQAEQHLAGLEELSSLADRRPLIDVMRGAVGMRNAIIHGYLNLDWGKVEAVLAERKYREVAVYLDAVTETLLNNTP